MKVQIGGMGNRFRGNRGAVAVETAVILPILLLLLFGIVEFGLLFHRMQGVHAASREAARLGSLDGVTYNQIDERARSAAPPFIDVDEDLEVTVTQVLTIGGVDTESDITGEEVACDSDSLLVQSADAAMVRVDLHLRNPDTYGVLVPLWGTFAFSHPSTGVFACEV